jgi:hypothetical protein
MARGPFDRHSLFDNAAFILVTSTNSDDENNIAVLIADADAARFMVTGMDEGPDDHLARRDFVRPPMTDIQSQ